MRTFSTSVTGRLQKLTGIEPIVFIGVRWGDNTEVFYSSTDFVGTKKSIVSITDLETTLQLSGTGSSQSTSVVLSDTDGALSNVLSTIDIHKRPAKVYMGFPGVPISESVVLLDGEINTDIIWDERSRTLSFTILSKIEGRVFGFSAEDGLFHNVDEQTRNSPWPFRFGDTCYQPAVRVQAGVGGTLRVGHGLPDNTLDAKICQARNIECPLIEDPLVKEPEFNQTLGEDAAQSRNKSKALGLGYDPGGSNITRRFKAANAGGPTDDVSGRPLIRDVECENAKFQTLCQLLRDRATQQLYVSDTLQVINGDTFPQGELIDIRVDDVVFSGTMTGETFTILLSNRKSDPSDIVCEPPVEECRQQVAVPFENPTSVEECETTTGEYQLRVVGGAGNAWRDLEGIPDSSFKWLPSGSNVTLENAAAIVNIVSLVPGTVTGVFAYRTFGDTKQMTEVPTDYYEVVETNYGGLTAVEVHLDRKLSSFDGENWDDVIYTRFDSDVGPNPVDVIQWIIENYTDFSVDTATFASVESALTNYPCNFYYAAKESVINVLDRIAYEARCALIVTDDIVKLHYLPAEPDADKTLTGADIVAGSFKFSHTRTEELVTSQEVTWSKEGATQLSTDDIEEKFTVANNVQKYGYTTSTRSYDTITDFNQALKTATFWSIRDSNTWRFVEFETTLEHMDLELFDTIELNISAFPNVKCVVQDLSVDVSSGIVSIRCWTPILSGTTDEYLWAWPGQNNPLILYPDASTEVETPKILITPPEDHPLYVDTPNTVVVPTTGDRRPSDIDDVFPPDNCTDATDPVLIDVIEPTFGDIRFAEDVKAQSRRADAAAEASNISNNIPLCGVESDEKYWEVQVGYHEATQIASTDLKGGVAPPNEIDCGGVNDGPCSVAYHGSVCESGFKGTDCIQFGSEAIAQLYVEDIQFHIGINFCDWRGLNKGPLFVNGPFAKGGPAPGKGDFVVGRGCDFGDPSERPINWGPPTEDG